MASKILIEVDEHFIEVMKRYIESTHSDTPDLGKDRTYLLECADEQIAKRLSNVGSRYWLMGALVGLHDKTEAAEYCPFCQIYIRNNLAMGRIVNRCCPSCGKVLTEEASATAKKIEVYTETTAPELSAKHLTEEQLMQRVTDINNEMRLYADMYREQPCIQCQSCGYAIRRLAISESEDKPRCPRCGAVVNEEASTADSQND
jgi:predicted Zn-ribbon and HTH transcriptional regulator